MSALERMVKRAKVIVCVGSGGVGKTTTAAIVGIHAARLGKRVVVLTVDPARRLASSLGAKGLDHDLQQIPLDGLQGGEAAGELWATMLDMKRTFDGIVERDAPDAATRDAILNNRFYQSFSTGLAGAQELSASERLLEVVSSGEWDLVVLDTPPSANALDFFDAPGRYFEALDSKAVQWVTNASAGGGGLLGGLLGGGTQVLLKVLSRFTGSEFFDELGLFLENFSTLLDGFRRRTEATQALFHADDTSFILVTAPDPATVDAALQFRSALEKQRLELDAVIANRVQLPLSAGATPTQDELAVGLRVRVSGLPETASRLCAEQVLRTVRDRELLAERDRAMLQRLRSALPGVPLVPVPLYSRDVHSLSGLNAMREDVFAGELRQASSNARA
ncbi:MAG: anion-transporting ArsA/GET3 family ATPase [Bradymonadia bacterium]|jgi:anion-transporting  ArsA/GET3 family ATPase